MKKSTIWLLALVMFSAFLALLFLQVRYMRTSMTIRSQQFDEQVTRSLYNVMRDLEQDQTRDYLEQDMIESENRYSQYNQPQGTQITREQTTATITNPDGSESRIALDITQQSINPRAQRDRVFMSPNRGASTISKTQYDMQQSLSKRYLHERVLLDEVIFKILNRASNEPIEERIDFSRVEQYIRYELSYNGLNEPFSFQIVDFNNKVIYSSPGFSTKYQDAVYTQILFPNDPPAKLNRLRAYFPTKRNYVYSELSFFIPSLLFTFILLITFIFTVVSLFRQKRLSEMKNDFINNMTHELKTPVSTISLASQMLKDESILKSPDVFKHVTGVIHDETKRLSFQVEKVLQMSLFDKQKTTLKMREMDVNDLVVSVANTHVLKVEKLDGTLDVDLQAEHSTIKVDEMHFTNVLFNILDNALKYRKRDVAPELMIRTRNEGNKIIISIEDNGIGMKKEDAKKVFERFYRVHTGNRHDVKGFGLGLAYVKKIVTDVNGTIRAESELGKGTKFIISLPVITEK
ncbi:MAG: HAMP domain-containing sensor histidine kinase [Proteiniphilum sp.]|jgi:two-component system phosphate regulon sensor histidine kinase PhoR|nr:HAMP domain-containing sensor histidine kinase [Proteiniphilum sp.]NCB25166.1 HAMP domain-containing histidine kinase [Bacteroidia bacterium]MDD2936666.1 HAMP domain-containing sensor histidine kinase [Proteiniphilum sp.]MDD3075568.1 HAMP domain-containing sensor histidine kinase [Proteiniphilum sp.]MDD3955990.1 HAMP domain-containing sensor histidine kinase [Proteiniphilum sp.]